MVAIADNRLDMYYEVPISTEDFIGRLEYIEDIRQKLSGDSDNIPSIAIWGMPGIGKSETVLRYAFKYRSMYSTIYHFNCRSQKDLKASLEKFFDFLAERKDNRLMKAGYQVSDKCKSVKRWFEEEQNWLAIFDDIELNPDFNLRDYLPQHCNGHRILISRSRSIMAFAEHELEISGMSESDSSKMLLKRAGLHQPTIDEKKDAARIARELDTNPFSIELAAKYVREVQCPLEVYLGLLRDSKKKKLLGSPKGLMGVQMASWELAYQKLEESQGSMSLLKFFALLDGSKVSPVL
jgi:NB-ARC domain